MARGFLRALEDSLKMRQLNCVCHILIGISNCGRLIVARQYRKMGLRNRAELQDEFCKCLVLRSLYSCHVPYASLRANLCLTVTPSAFNDSSVSMSVPGATHDAASPSSYNKNNTWRSWVHSENGSRHSLFLSVAKEQMLWIK